MYTIFTQITPAITLRRSRLLPVTGTVQVRLGQKVNGDDVIAEASVPTRHELVDVVRILGLSGPKAADALIQRKVGETIAENDIIAETGGIFSRVIRTPAPGRIMSIRNGQVLIQTETSKLELLALYSGVVDQIIPDRGAFIKTTGSVIQAAWGNGKFASGPLRCQAENPSVSLSGTSFDINARGTVIAAANCIDANLLDTAASIPIAGLILGSMPYELVEKALKLPIPVLLIDGFGKSGMNPAAFKYLTKYNNHEVTLNATNESGSVDQKPEAVISADIENEVGQEQSRVTAGQMVRIHSAPFLGQIGVVEKVLPGLTLMPNGLRVCAASVMMDNKERKTIPVDNLDGIGFTQSNF